MLDEFIAYGKGVYWSFFALLCFARGMDFLSTWIATPTLVLEANPIAKKFGWKFGIALNLVLCAAFAAWPLPAIIIITSSGLVAARNFQSAWIMRSFGEERYSLWISERLAQAPIRLVLFCIGAQAFMVGGIGAGLMIFSRWQQVPFAVGVGMLTYAFAVLIYTLLSMRRRRRSVPIHNNLQGGRGEALSR